MFDILKGIFSGKDEAAASGKIEQTVASIQTAGGLESSPLAADPPQTTSFEVPAPSPLANFDPIQAGEETPPVQPVIPEAPSAPEAPFDPAAIPPVSYGLETTGISIPAKEPYIPVVEPLEEITPKLEMPGFPSGSPAESSTVVVEPYKPTEPPIDIKSSFLAPPPDESPSAGPSIDVVSPTEAPAERPFEIPTAAPTGTSVLHPNIEPSLSDIPVKPIETYAPDGIPTASATESPLSPPLESPIPGISAVEVPAGPAAFEPQSPFTSAPVKEPKMPETVPSIAGVGATTPEIVSGGIGAFGSTTPEPAPVQTSPLSTGSPLGSSTAGQEPNPLP